MSPSTKPFAEVLKSVCPVLHHLRPPSTSPCPRILVEKMKPFPRDARHQLGLCWSWVLLKYGLKYNCQWSWARWHLFPTTDCPTAEPVNSRMVKCHKVKRNALLHFGLLCFSHVFSNFLEHRRHSVNEEGVLPQSRQLHGRLWDVLTLVWLCNTSQATVWKSSASLNYCNHSQGHCSTLRSLCGVAQRSYRAG